MRVYELSSETLRKGRRRFAIGAVFYVCFWLLLLLSYLLLPGHEKMEEVAGGLVMVGGLWTIVIIGGAVRLHDLAHGSQTIKIGEDWIKLPGQHKLPFSGIAEIKRTGTTRHPKVVLKLDDAAGVFRATVMTVYPQQYTDADDLEARLVHLLEGLSPH